MGSYWINLVNTVLTDTVLCQWYRWILYTMCKEMLDKHQLRSWALSTSVTADCSGISRIMRGWDSFLCVTRLFFQSESVERCTCFFSFFVSVHSTPVLTTNKPIDGRKISLVALLKEKEKKKQNYECWLNRCWSVMNLMMIAWREIQSYGSLRSNAMSFKVLVESLFEFIVISSIIISSHQLHEYRSDEYLN